MLTFRGTNGGDFKNWVTNIKGATTDYPGVSGVKVHIGFNQAYNEVKEKVQLAIKTLLHVHGSKAKRIFIAGHSLGGALALLAAVDIKANMRPSLPISLYTYGQPRVGNQAWANYVYSLFPNNYVRVVHADDTVPHVPPRVSGFKHAGTEVWFKNSAHDGQHIECRVSATETEDNSCSNSLLLKTSISNHVTYYGMPVSGNCDRRQPSGTLASAQQFFLEEDFTNYSFFIQNDLEEAFLQ